MIITRIMQLKKKLSTNSKVFQTNALNTGQQLKEVLSLWKIEKYYILQRKTSFHESLLILG